MENTEILKIDGVEYDHRALLGLSKQSPDIQVKLTDIEVFGIDINSSQFNVKEYPIELNNTFEENDLTVFHFFGKVILLTGYKKYSQAKQSGLETISAKLVSKPVLKKARFEVFVKPSFLGKTTVNIKRNYRSDPSELLGQEVSQQKSSRVSRSRRMDTY